jgi:hypothetical protein
MLVMAETSSERTTLIFADVSNGDGTMWRALHWHDDRRPAHRLPPTARVVAADT